MDYLAALLKLTDQYGLTPVLAIIVVVGGGLMLRGIVSTWNAVRLSNAESRNRTEKAEADSTTTLSQSIREMADSNNAILRQTIEWMKNAEADRGKQFNVLTDILGQIRGIGLAQSDDAKARKAMSNTLNEVADRIVPIQTDLRDVSIRTAGMESGFAKLLDERLTPILTLLIGMNTQVNDLVASGKASGQTIETILLDITKITEAALKIIAEFGLLKDLIFDRDDRIAHILNTLTPKEKTP